MKYYINERNIREGVFLLNQENLRLTFSTEKKGTRMKNYGNLKYRLWKKVVHAMEKLGTGYRKKRYTLWKKRVRDEWKEMLVMLENTAFVKFCFFL